MEAIGKLWARVPVLIRAIVGGELLTMVGSTLLVLPVLGNISFLPEIPWALPVTMAMAWLYWRYLSGYGAPAFSAESRRRMTRTDTSTTYSPRLVALYLACGLVMLLSFRLLMPSLMEVRPPDLSINPRDFSLLTAIGFIGSVALTAGLVEEVALRGYAQRLLEEKYGLMPAILVVSGMFWAAHLNHDYMTFAHVPFYILVSATLGVVVYLTKSLVPAIIIHIVADLILLPAYGYRWPQIVGEMVTATPVWRTGTTPEFLIVAALFLVASGATLVMGRLLYRDCLESGARRPASG
jgi:membrane protease YdiL (CAAX protease family)